MTSQRLDLPLAMKPAGLLALIATLALTAGCNSADQANSTSQAEGEQPSPELDTSNGKTLTQKPNSQAPTAPITPSTATPATSFAAIASPPNSSSLPTARSTRPIIQPSGRKNPFALAEQPEFEVRYLPPEAPALASTKSPLPPIPQVEARSAEPSELSPLAIATAPTAVIPTATPGLVTAPETVPAPTVVPLPVGPETSLNLPSDTAPNLAVNPESLPSADNLPTIRPTAPSTPTTASTSTAASSSITAPTPAPSPTALAESLEITGVIQIGDQAAVIIKDTGSSLSRTVTPGARLAGGAVELRHIDTTTEEPHIVLEQNGVEVIRAIGV